MPPPSYKLVYKPYELYRDIFPINRCKIGAMFTNLATTGTKYSSQALPGLATFLPLRLGVEHKRWHRLANGDTGDDSGGSTAHHGRHGPKNLRFHPSHQQESDQLGLNVDMSHGLMSSGIEKALRSKNIPAR